MFIVKQEVNFATDVKDEYNKYSIDAVIKITRVSSQIQFHDHTYNLRECHTYKITNACRGY